MTEPLLSSSTVPPPPILPPQQGSNRLHPHGRANRAISIRVDSFCLKPTQEQRDPNKLRVQSFKRTVRVLQLDHSQYTTTLLSWTVCVLLVVVIPVLRLCFVKAASGDTRHELVFQPFVVVDGTALSVVSFLFLTQAIRRHGFRGVLFLDAAEEEVMEVQEEYDAIIEKGRMVLAKLFIPSFFIYVIFEAWFFSDVKLVPLPFETKTTALSFCVIIVLTTLSWIFQTTTYLYSCILFSTVCSLQELKMLRFKGVLETGLDPEFHFLKYTRIMKGLQATSHRFRAFLGLIFTITILGFLASMYKVVAAERVGIDTLMAGEIVILNVVSLSGVGLCLKSSSKLSHLHRRIVKVATSMHARMTFETSKSAYASAGKGEGDSPMERLSSYFEVQDACAKRAAFVNFLSSSSAGISVYGFVLDRFFIHTSVGALLTTTWFILGRSLG